MFRRSDARVVTRVLAGHRDDYAVLVERYWGLAYAVGFAQAGNYEDARDVAQEALVAAYQKLDTLRERDKFAPWLAAIARNLSSRLTAKRRREQAAAPDTPPDYVIPDLEAREMREMVRAHLMQMDEAPREVLVLHYFSGMSTREIARALAISTDAAEKRLQRARKELGDALLEHLRGPGESRLDKEKRNQVMGLVAAAPVAWKTAGAATATAVSALLHGARLHIVLPVAAVCVAGVGLLNLQTALKSEPKPAEVEANAAAQDAAAPADTPPGKPTLISDLPAQPKPQEEPQGPRTIQGYTLDCEQKPVSGATVTLLNDGPEEVPPWDLRTVATTQSGADGGFVFENVSGDSLSVIAWTGGTIGFSWAGDGPYEKTVWVPMLPASSLSGRVVDKDGKPAPGVVVAPVYNEGDGKFYPHTRKREGEEVASAFFKAMSGETDAEGRFTINRVWPGTWRVAAKGPGCGLSVSPMAPAGATDIELTLLPECRVTGTVVDPAGAPVAGATAYLVGDRTLEKKSADDGSFLFDGLRPRDYELWIDHPTLVLEKPMQVLLLTPGNTTTVTVSTTKGAVVSGRVLDAVTGEPVAGASLSGTDIKTAADGAFRVEGFRAGRFELSARKRGYTFPEYHTVHLEPGEVLDNQELTVKKASDAGERVVSGIVVDEEGHPLRMAHVVVTGMKRGWYGADSEDDGWFEVRLPETEHGVYISAVKRDLAAPPEGPYELGEEGLQDVVIRLRPGWGTIRGRAVAANGEAIMRPLMSIQFLGQKGGFQPIILANKVGWFDVLGVIPGTYEITVANDYGEPQSVPLKVSVGEGEVVDSLVIRCGGGGMLAIAGVVVDDTGKPIATEQLRIWPVGRIGENLTLSATTDSQGRFRFEGLEEGEYEIDHGFTRVAAGDTNVRLVIVRNAIIEGVVLKPDGSPAQEFDLLAHSGSENTFSMPGVDNKQFDQNGRFKTGTNNSEAYLVAQAEGFSPGITHVTGLKPGETRQGVEVWLREPSRVAGRVVGSDGRPIEGVAIFGTDESTARFNHVQPLRVDDLFWPTELAKSSAAGEFEILGLPDKAFLFYAHHDEYIVSDLVELTPAPGRKVQLDFMLSRGGSVSGRVMHGGKPVADANVRASVSVEVEVPPPPVSQGEPLQPGDVQLATLQNAMVGAGPMLRENTIWKGEAKTDSDGAYTIAGIPDGKLRVHASWGWQEGALFVQVGRQVELEMSRGAALKADFAVADDAAGISGEVFLEGQEVAYVNVYAKDASGAGMSSYGPGNKFDIGHFGAGVWEITASGYIIQDEWAYTDGPVELTLAPGQRQTLQIHLTPK